METLYPASLVSSSTTSWLTQQRKRTTWTREENKNFELAIVIYDEKTPYRWHKVAAMIGKSVTDVVNQYKELVLDICKIEAGLVPIPGYLAASFTFLGENCRFDAHRKRGRSSNQERKKGVPWTEEEHRRFLLGLEKHGKGDWRNISRNFVISKNPTQVASHAQKYFLRQISGGKDKRRPSIHDITTFHLTQSHTTSTTTTTWSQSVDEKPSSTVKNDCPLMVLDSIAYPQDIASCGHYLVNISDPASGLARFHG